MIQFSAILLLYVYVAMMGLLVAVSLGHIFHAIRFGGLSPLSIFSSGLFIAGMFVILWGSNAMLFSVDWSGVFQVDLPSIHLFSRP